MIARGMSHVSFPVHDLERSLAFYRDTLGFVAIPRPDLGLPGAWLQAGNAQVHLIQRFPGATLGSPPPSVNPMAQHVALTIDDYAGALATLHAHGLEVLETNDEQGQLWVQDPDGHVIELNAR
ncbi:MAG TPA: VOC family protein [Candidatus Binatia bacterium]|nr:VOC family protein [Candidatus Binatia bacterium]